MELTSDKKFQSNFSILGMTCKACVKTVTDKLSSIQGVKSVNVSLSDKKAEITASRNVNVTEVSNALVDTPRYSAIEYNSRDGHVKTETIALEKTWFQTYKPLITVFIFITLVSLAYQVSMGMFNYHIFMNHIMAGFFIGLSFFKFLDLNAFSESFSSYDPVAQRWLGYGKVYPFIESVLGLLFISGKFLMLANALTILVLSLTTYGVYLRLQSKSKFQCACLGTTFNLPLSNVTIAENIVMIIMALYGITM